MIALNSHNHPNAPRIAHSTATTAGPLHTHSATIPVDARLRFSNILRSELIKVWSLRSTWWSLGIIITFGLGVSLLLGTMLESGGIPSEPSARFTAANVVFGGVLFGQLVAAVLGVLSMSSEFSSGTIVTTLAAVPTRLPVLAAKVVVLFGLVTTAGLISTFGSWAITYPMFDALGIATGLGTPGLLTALVGGALQLGLITVFALGVATIVRSAAAGIAIVLGILLVIPGLLSAASSSMEWVRDVWPFLLSNAGEAMSTVPAGTGLLLSPVPGALVVLCWSTVSLVVGAFALQRRDA